MFQYIACFCLLAVVSSASGGYKYAGISNPIHAPAVAPVATYQQPSQPAASPLTEIHKDFYFFKAPEDQHTITLPTQKISAFSQSAPTPSHQQVSSAQHAAEPVIHYISYQTPAEAQQILQQLIGDHVAHLGGKALAFNSNNQHGTMNVQRQYVDAAFSHVKNEIHIEEEHRAGSVSNVNTLAGYLPPAAIKIVGKDFPTATTYVNVEPQYHVPVTSNVDSPYVVDLPSATTLNSQYLLPAISSPSNELQPPDASNNGS